MGPWPNIISALKRRATRELALSVHYVKTWQYGNCLQARKRKFTRNWVVSTLILGLPFSWTGRKKNSVVYTTQSIVFCYRSLSRQRHRWAWIWETLFTQYKLVDFVSEGVFQNWEGGVREIPKKSTVIILSWGERKRSERRDTGMSAFEWQNPGKGKSIQRKNCRH